MEPEKISGDVGQGLARLYKLRWWMCGTWLSFFPFLFVVAVIPLPDWLGMSFGVLWMASWVVLMLVNGFYRCPNCRRFFNMRWPWYHNVLTSECVHCGLSISMRSRSA
jgi:hypothetical protein